MNITMDRDKTEVPVETMVSRAFLGVHYEMTYGEVVGSHINTVVSGTPAEKAALRAGDVITAVDGERLFILEDLARIVSRHKPGDRVMLSIVRDGKDRQYPVVLGERKEHFFAPGNFETGSTIELNFDGMEPGTEVNAIAGRAFLGVTILRSEMNINGKAVNTPDDLVVEKVEPNSPAAEMGLRKGDVLRGINSRMVHSYSELTSTIGSMNPGDRVAVVFERDGKPMVVNGTLKEAAPVMPNPYSANLHFEEEPLSGSITERARELARRQAESRGTVREFSIVIRMDEVSAQEAQAISEKSGQQFSATNNLPVNNLSLAPNPSSGLFTVSFDLPGRGPTQIRVIDVNGRVAYQEALHDFSGRFRKEFDITGRSKGIYYMQITQNGRTFSRKIVTQ
jgi:membrane-associated protease RseP (regulator of RpoE activity)